MPGKEPEIGPTARTVAENVKRLRMAQNMNFTQLAERLAAAANWSINAVGIRRIETGERRVTPDDLTALAVALGVSPITLLMPGMPGADDPGAMVEVTGIRQRVHAGELWVWLKADRTSAPPSWANVSRPLFEANALPEWEWGHWSRDTDGND